MTKLKSKPNLGKRIAATLVDYLLIWTFFFSYIFAVGEPNEEGGYSISGLPALIPFAFWFCLIVLTEVKWGATLGHSIFGLSVKTFDGAKPGFSQILKRRFCDIVDFWSFFGIAAIILIKNTTHNQRLGDIWAKTIVIDIKDPDQKEFSFEFEDQK